MYRQPQDNVLLNQITFWIINPEWDVKAYRRAPFESETSTEQSIVLPTGLSLTFYIIDVKIILYGVFYYHVSNVLGQYPEDYLHPGRPMLQMLAASISLLSEIHTCINMNIIQNYKSIKI